MGAQGSYTFSTFYQGQNDLARLQSMGSISALSTHCTSASLATNLKETFPTYRVIISLSSHTIKARNLHMLKAQDKVCNLLECLQSGSFLTLDVKTISNPSTKGSFAGALLSL